MCNWSEDSMRIWGLLYSGQFYSWIQCQISDLYYRQIIVRQCSQYHRYGHHHGYWHRHKSRYGHGHTGMDTDIGTDTLARIRVLTQTLRHGHGHTGTNTGTGMDIDTTKNVNLAWLHETHQQRIHKQNYTRYNGNTRAIYTPRLTD